MRDFEKKALTELKQIHLGRIYCYFMETYRPGHPDFDARLRDFSWMLLSLKKGASLVRYVAKNFPPNEYKILGWTFFTGRTRYTAIRAKIFPLADGERQEEYATFSIIIEALAKKGNSLALLLQSTI